MAKPVFDFDAAWCEAAGDVPEPGTKLGIIYAFWKTRARWEAGEPIALIIRAALDTPTRWVNGETYLL